MQRNKPSYLHLAPEDALPAVERLTPFIAIVLVEDEVPEMWQWEVCRWLASSGCRRMLAWGSDCEAWKEAVEEANQEAFDYEEIPPENLVIATSHDNEEWEDVFWYAKHRSSHPAYVLATTVIVHIAKTARKEELESLYADA
jgi:hypothetical protein